ncbi:hypothetical protein EAI_03298 [Harpegnathos saltator]|uniref:Uncharacterized protein n=1 Tax=Harpegnathos saltator TaxID=610380 RepID=E2C3P3_HARSA|nr:hypothetical protein EAI_03298 [Harpegnathos saltator]
MQGSLQICAERSFGHSCYRKSQGHHTAAKKEKSIGCGLCTAGKYNLRRTRAVPEKDRAVMVYFRDRHFDVTEDAYQSTRDYLMDLRSWSLS